MLQDTRNEKAPVADTGASKRTPKRDCGSNYTRKLPPFGKQLASRLRRGDRPANCIWIACGTDAWGRAKYDLMRSDSEALCLPYGDDPIAYKWPVKGLSCVVIHTGGLNTITLRTLGAELIQAGANLVAILGVMEELGAYAVYFKPGRAEA